MLCLNKNKEKKNIENKELKCLKNIENSTCVLDSTEEHLLTLC